MEHELRINAEIIRKSKSRWVLLPIVRKLLAQPNQHPIQPSQHIRRIVNVRLEHRNTRHQHRSGFLVKRRSDAWRSRLSKVACDSRDAEALLAR